MSQFTRQLRREHAARSHRFAVHPGAVALRERHEDIPLLTRHFLQKSARELGVEAKRLSDPAIKYLSGLDFQGNVRQLENLCHWLTVMAPGQQVEIVDLPTELREAVPTAMATDWESGLEGEVDRLLAAGVDDVHGRLSQIFERILISRALARTGGRRIEAAQALGIGLLPFTFPGLVIASVFYSLPFVVQPIQNAFEAIGERPLEVAATLRASPWDAFWSVAVPLARPGFISGAILGFAHTVGEFGVEIVSIVLPAAKSDDKPLVGSTAFTRYWFCPDTGDGSTHGEPATPVATAAHAPPPDERSTVKVTAGVVP